MKGTGFDGSADGHRQRTLLCLYANTAACGLTYWTMKQRETQQLQLAAQTRIRARTTLALEKMNFYRSRRECIHLSCWLYTEV